jgi:putative oxidoreductase
MDAQSSVLSASGRLLLAAIFLISGIMEMLAPDATLVYISLGGLPAPTLVYAIAIAIELLGSGLLIAGFKTRAAAAALALFSLAAAFSFHRDFSDGNQMMHFMKNIGMMGGLLQVVAYGGGSFSLDNRRAGNARRT